jgi:SAM-dependent methyltransferase
LRRPKLPIRLPARVGSYVRAGPISSSWGEDRGTPLDRWYIERFLEEQRHHIRGRALEVKNDDYLRRFGSGVEQFDVLDIDEENPRATVVADLAAATGIADASYDSIVLTQVIQYIPDVRAAIGHCARILRPRGVVLATAPAINRIDHLPQDHWRFTVASCSALFGHAFGEPNVEVRAHGTALVAAAFLSGLAAEELPSAELERHDPRYPIVVTVRARRA